MSRFKLKLKSSQVSFQWNSTSLGTHEINICSKAIASCFALMEEQNATKVSFVISSFLLHTNLCKKSSFRSFVNHLLSNQFMKGKLRDFLDLNIKKNIFLAVKGAVTIPRILVIVSRWNQYCVLNDQLAVRNARVPYKT